MRTDVRLGVFFSMVIVLALGGYFVYPRGGTEAIPLTGDVKPLANKDAPAKLASNSGKATGRKKQTVPTRKTQTARRTNKTKPRVPTQRKNTPKNSTRLANGATKKRNLPVSGSSLANRAQTKTAKSNRGPVSSYQPSKSVANTTNKVNKARRASKPAGKKIAPGKFTEKPGTPTPPGLLAATRKKAAPRNEPAVDLHRVQPGDTFATLAKAYYGSAKHVDFLMKANPGVDPTKMQVGVTVRVPALSTKQGGAIPSASRQVKKVRTPSAIARTYTVRSGDSFYRIAEKQLGDASRWKELFEANKKLVGNDPSRLKVGQVLTLPAK